MKPQPTTMWTGPLDGASVLENGTGIGVRYCARLLALLGAQVVTAPGSSADVAIGGLSSSERAYARWLDEGRTAVADLDRPWDLVLAGQDPADLDAARELVGRLDGRPTLVELAWFSADGPYARWRGTDEVVAALCGLAYAFGPADGPPTLARGHVPQILAGANACNLALAALLAPPDRRPSTIAVEVLESTMCLTETGAVAHHANPRAVSTRVGVNRFVPTYPCSSYRAADGWVGITCLTPAQWDALCREIGREDLLAEDAYATAARRLWRGDEIDAALAPAVAERTCDEWVAVGLARRIPITSMPEPGRLPFVEHWRRRGSFAAVDGDDSQGAPLAPTMPSVVRWDGNPRPRWDVDPAVDGPLSGLRVLDLTMGWAGPSTTRTSPTSAPTS